MKKTTLLLLLGMFLLGMTHTLLAQTDTTRVQQKEEEEFDFSEFDDDFDVATDGGSGKRKAVRLADQKVIGLSPTKLISVEYDFQGGFDMTSVGTEQPVHPALAEHTGRVQRNHGFRMQANFPVISRNTMVLNLGVNFWDSRYDFANMSGNPNQFQQRLHARGLRTGGVNATLFKPLNNGVNYLIFQGQADLNGNYNFGNIRPDLALIKYSGAIVYGWKKSDRLSYGFGLTRTYRGGEVLHIPVVLYNHTYNANQGYAV